MEFDMSDVSTITPREKLDFGLDGDIPKYWVAGDPFKSRFGDALSTMFPEVERYFITSIRAYRDEITDPELLSDIKHFIRQEGQHGVVHDKYNQRLKRQGINVDAIEKLNRKILDFANKHHSVAFNMATTAGAEHHASLMARCFFSRKSMFENADPRMRALYAWHAMEEVEHKCVAFDVMQKGARTGYFVRILALFLTTVMNVVLTLGIMEYMFRADGFGFWQRARLWAKGLWWFYGPKGIFLPTVLPYLRYLRPGFHPSQEPLGEPYKIWLKTFNDTADPIAAGDSVQARAI
jgi:hypothetical protein